MLLILCPRQILLSTRWMTGWACRRRFFLKLKMYYTSIINNIFSAMYQTGHFRTTTLMSVWDVLIQRYTVHTFQLQLSSYLRRSVRVMVCQCVSVCVSLLKIYIFLLMSQKNMAAAFHVLRCTCFYKNNQFWLSLKYS